MFTNLKKKLESEVGDLPRLTPNLRSITQSITSTSEKLSPLGSRHGSVSSLVSETTNTSYNNNVKTSSQEHAAASTKEVNKSSSAAVRRHYEEKLQTQELDFAYRLSSKDEEIVKLQRICDNVNSLLQSKECEVREKLVRVQEDMDNLEGFSKQENSKIKHLLLNREEELSQLRASLVNRDSRIIGLELELKSMGIENERMGRSLDGVLVASGGGGVRLEMLEKEKAGLQDKLLEKDSLIEKLLLDLERCSREESSSSEEEAGRLRHDFDKYREDGEARSAALEATIASKDREIANLQQDLASKEGVEARSLALEEEISSMKVENSGELAKLQEELEKCRERERLLLEEKLAVEASSGCKDSTIDKLLLDLERCREESQSELLKLSSSSSLAIKEEAEKQINSRDKLITKLQQDLSNYVTESDATIKKLVESDKSATEAKLKSKDLEIQKLQQQLKQRYSESSSLRSEKDFQIANLEQELKLKAETTLLKLQQSEISLAELQEDFSTYRQQSETELLSLRSEKSSLERDLTSCGELIKCLESELVVKLEEENKKTLELGQSEIVQKLKSQELEVELQKLEVENSELVLQISEIQSRCDQVEEENVFLKNKSLGEGAVVCLCDKLKKRVGELEVELGDRGQMLKQQSNQLQDLRRSLAKEINRNQVSESGSASPTTTMSTTSVQPQYNGHTPTNQPPPTLPPQETDVNFMYLRSVLFKYLTTTDTQVREQLTRVVATLLHLSEEESVLLQGQCDNKSGLFSGVVIGRS